jgi:hypothetical protein
MAVMREWMYVLTPVSLIVYFVVFPERFHAFIVWFGHVVLQ